MAFIEDSDPGMTGLHPWNAFSGQTNARMTPNLSGYQTTQGPQASYAEAIRRAQLDALNGYQQGNQTAQGQSLLASQLQDQSVGRGPSLAQLQLQQATQQNGQQAAGAIASQRGLNPGLAARQILNAQAMMNQQAAGQSAQLRMQEQMAARAQLGSTLAAQRGQDIGAQQANTQLAGVTGGAQNQQNATDYTRQGIDANTAMGNAQNQNVSDQSNLGINQRNAAGEQQAIGNVINVAGGALEKAGGLGGAGAAGGMAKGAGGIGTGPSGFAHGGLVPGDSPKNDVVPAMLSPGEEVLPRSVTMAPDAPEKAKAFVEAIRSQKDGSDESEPDAAAPEGYGQVLARQRAMQSQLARIEQMLGGSQGHYDGGRIEAANYGRLPYTPSATDAAPSEIRAAKAAYLAAQAAQKGKKMADGGAVKEERMTLPLRKGPRFYPEGGEFQPFLYGENFQPQGEDRWTDARNQDKQRKAMMAKGKK